TRVRDLDGRVRKVRVFAPTVTAAQNLLKERIRDRPVMPGSGVLQQTSSFSDLADVWLADLDVRDLAENTKESYRSWLRLHVRPAFEHYTLAEVTAGRVEWFLAKQARVSFSQGRATRTVLNMLFAFALRHDAIAPKPGRGDLAAAAGLLPAPVPGGAQDGRGAHARFMQVTGILHCAPPKLRGTPGAGWAIRSPT
ncbi:MAG: hypothetical protein WCA30_00755, partial [Dermatophilaceae bacterium]